MPTDRNDQPRSADGQGPLNPRGEAQFGFPSLVGDGNECQSQHRIVRPELVQSRVAGPSVIAIACDPFPPDCYAGFAFADGARSTDRQCSRAVYAFGDRRIRSAGADRGWRIRRFVAGLRGHPAHPERRVLFRGTSAERRRRIQAPGPWDDRRARRIGLCETVVAASERSFPLHPVASRRRRVRSGVVRMPDSLGSDVSVPSSITGKPLRLRPPFARSPRAVQRRLFPAQNGFVSGRRRTGADVLGVGEEAGWTPARVRS